MRELVDLFQPLAKIAITHGWWNPGPHTIDIFTAGLAGICYELTYNFRLFDTDQPLDQYEPDFQTQITDLLNTARGQNHNCSFDAAGLHHFIETIVTHILKLEAAQYTSYDTEKLEFLIEVTIAMIESRFERLSYYAQKSANPDYAYKPGPPENQLLLPGMERQTAW
ncbi:MAG: hypothetical protein K0S38_211 [Candidatus Paceibacter sp.]|jgi:hypothetical protein|nr:hypothetical protein [Candidatus Paceibacter sp.]